jgi:transposase-like protein
MTITLGRGPGAPTKLNDAMISSLTECVLSGNYLVTACQLSGVHEATLYTWLKQADADIKAGVESDFTRLYDTLKAAEAKSEAKQVENVIACAAGGQTAKRVTRTHRDGTEEVEESFAQPQWLASMTYLERRHPDRWGRRDRTRIDVNETKQVTITHVEIVLNEAGMLPSAPLELPGTDNQGVIDV